MGLFRPSHARRGPDPYYDWKVVLFTTGAAVGLIGMFTNHDGLILLAVPILGVGIVLRWLPRRGGRGARPEDAEAPGEEDVGAGPGNEPAADLDEAAPDERGGGSGPAPTAGEQTDQPGG